MREPDSPIFNRFTLALGVLVGVTVGQVALADSDQLAATQAAVIPSPEELPVPIESPEATATALTGSEVYTAICIACHAAPGVGGAPALGDADAWAARIAQGKEKLIDHALHGFSGSTGIMPRKGGRIDLSDEEVIGAVEFMLEQVDQ